MNIENCKKCGKPPLCSTNNVPGNWYSIIECDEIDCSDQENVSELGDLKDGAIEEWNRLQSTT